MMIAQQQARARMRRNMRNLAKCWRNIKKRAATAEDLPGATVVTYREAHRRRGWWSKRSRA